MDELIERLKNIDADPEKLLERCLSYEPKNTKMKFEIGNIYATNKIYKDTKKAIEWLTKAANEGHPLAMNNLGEIYWKVLKDNEKAVEWFSKGISLECHEAIFNLGHFYEESKASREIITNLYMKAINLGNIYAMRRLSIFYKENRYPAKDVAIECYLKQASLGNVVAIHNLAVIYYDSIPSDIEKALEYYLKAVEKGYTSSMIDVGYIYLYNKKNFEQAMELYHKAARLDNATAYYNIGIVYGNVEYKNFDYFKAIENFVRARELYSEDSDRKDCLKQILICCAWIGEKNIDKVKLEQYFSEVVAMREKNETMKKQIEDLRTELEYRPDGSGAVRAREDFELLSQKGS